MRVCGEHHLSKGPAETAADPMRDMTKEPAPYREPRQARSTATLARVLRAAEEIASSAGLETMTIGGDVQGARHTVAPLIHTGQRQPADEQLPLPLARQDLRCDDAGQEDHHATGRTSSLDRNGEQPSMPCLCSGAKNSSSLTMKEKMKAAGVPVHGCGEAKRFSRSNRSRVHASWRKKPTSRARTRASAPNVPASSRAALPPRVTPKMTSTRPAVMLTAPTEA